MRKLSCLRLRRSLEVYAAAELAGPVRKRLRDHLACCPDCSADLAGLQSAARDLNSLFVASGPQSGFADATWARLSASKPHGTYGSLYAVCSAAALAAIAFAVGFHHQTVSAPVPERIARSSRPAQIVSDEGAARPPSQAEASRAKPAKPRMTTRRRSARHLTYHRRARRRTSRPKTYIARSVQMRATTRLATAISVKPKSPPPVQWDRLASWYEYQGDYQSAAAAYQRAARERPSDALVFNAGRASECAGDVGDAVQWYARVLKHDHEEETQAKPDSRPRKGTWQWNDNRDSA